MELPHAPQRASSGLQSQSPSARLHWAHDTLQRVHEHVAARAPPSACATASLLPPLLPNSSSSALRVQSNDPHVPSPTTTAFAMRLRQRLSSAARSVPSDDVDGLEGVEDAKVDSEDDMFDPDFDIGLSRRRSSAAARRSRRQSHSQPQKPPTQRRTNPIFPPTHNHSEGRRQSQASIPPSAPSLPSRGGSAYSAAIPFLPELPLDDDTVAYSARSSQAHMDPSRPHFKLPLGSPANSYLTQMSSWKSLGQGQATRLHRDYSKIFRDSDDKQSSRRPGESSIEIAGGDLYVTAPLSERWITSHVIGEGGYATVRFARRNKDGPSASSEAHKVSAVKIISKKNLDSYNDRMVSREVFIFRLLSMAGGHPNLVELFEVCEDDGHVYLVMELLEGGELFTRIAERGQYTERDAALLVVSMLSSLQFCHRLNITHRDVKPENFVFATADSDGADVKLTDFGIAFYSEDPNAVCKTLCGTPLYVAPEVLLRQPYGPEADLWSLGVIVYIMLVGYPPFDDNDLVQLVKKIKYRPVKFDGPEWTLISDKGKQFLANLLDKDASNRMTAQQALEHEWLRNNCQAATSNELLKAQSNIKSFVSRKRWKAAIQGVKAMNRMHKLMELSRQGHVIDELDDISAVNVEVVDVANGEVTRGGENKPLPEVKDDVVGPDEGLSISSSSSSSEFAFPPVRRQPPVRTMNADRGGTPVAESPSRTADDGTDAEETVGATFAAGSSAMVNATSSMATLRSAESAASRSSSVRRTRRLGRLSLTLGRRASSALTADTTGMGVMKDGLSNTVLLAMDPAFESSDDSRQFSKDWRDARRRRQVVLDRGRASVSGGRVEAGHIVGANGGISRARPDSLGILGTSGADSDSGRVARQVTRGEAAGVVRKMSSHAKRFVGKGRRPQGVSLDERGRHAPTVVEIGEHRRARKFPWFR